MYRNFLTFIFSLVIIAPALASDDNTISVSGQFRVRAEGDNKTDMFTDRDFTSLRVRPQIKFTRDQTLEVFFTPQFSKVLGEALLTPNTTTTNVKTGVSGTTTDPVFNVHEAYAS